MVVCQEIKNRIVDGTEITIADNPAIQQHLQHCPACRRLFDYDQSLEAELQSTLSTSLPAPSGLVARARRRVESRTGQQRRMFPSGSWKYLSPALAMAVVAWIILINPLEGRLRSIDEVAAHGLAQHSAPLGPQEFQIGRMDQAGKWLTANLGYAVSLPDLARMGLILVGGRKCTLGRVDAAYLHCDASGKRASLFLIDPASVKFTIPPNRKYVIIEDQLQVTIWQEGGMICTLVV